MMKNDFRSGYLHFYLYLPWLFGHVEKRLDKKVKINFKIYDVTDWTTNNYNTHIAKYLENWKQLNSEIWLVNRIHKNIFLEKSYIESQILKN